jgi:hypothetical protein
MRRKYWKVEGNIQEEGMKKKAWLRNTGFEKSLLEVRERWKFLSWKDGIEERSEVGGGLDIDQQLTTYLLLLLFDHPATRHHRLQGP